MPRSRLTHWTAKTCVVAIIISVDPQSGRLIFNADNPRSRPPIIALKYCSGRMGFCCNDRIRKNIARQLTDLRNRVSG